MANGKQKGNRAERVAAKLFSDWSGEKFNRTPASGGLHWQRDNRVAGDIVPPEGLEFPFVVEVKSYRKGKLEILDFANQSGLLAKFWVKLVGEASALDKTPLLLFRANNMEAGTFVAITYYTPMTVWLRGLRWSIRIKVPRYQELVAFDMMDFALENDFREVARSITKSHKK